jgi:hypothetical protein
MKGLQNLHPRFKSGRRLQSLNAVSTRLTVFGRLLEYSQLLRSVPKFL